MQPSFTLYKELCEEPATVALAWLLDNPVVTASIIGPRILEQLESAVRATEVTLDETTLKKFDAVFPGLGGEAPMVLPGESFPLMKAIKVRRPPEHVHPQ